MRAGILPERLHATAVHSFEHVIPLGTSVLSGPRGPSTQDGAEAARGAAAKLRPGLPVFLRGASFLPRLGVGVCVRTGLRAGLVLSQAFAIRTMVRMTLTRTLEPESMSEMAEAEAYGEMSLGAVNRAFVDDLLASGSGERVIDLGCGPCDIPILLCESDPRPRVLAVDSSIEMLELAKRRIDISGMLDRITLQHADVKSLDDFETGMADLVISNSLLHHLADPGQAIAAAIRLVQPGGRLFFRDLVRPASEEELEALVELHGQNEADISRQLLRQSLWAALTLAEVEAIAGEFGIGRDSLSQTSDRHWTLDWYHPRT